MVLTPRMGALAANDRREISASLARAGQRAVRKRRFIDTGELRAPRRLGQHMRRTCRADLLIRIDQHFITNAFGKRRALNRHERVQHHQKPALHIGRAGRVQRILVNKGLALKRMVGRKHRIHVPCEKDAHRRLRPLNEAQHVADRLFNDLSFTRHDLMRARGNGLDFRAEFGEGLAKGVMHAFQPGEIRAAGIDGAPCPQAFRHGPPPVVQKGEVFSVIVSGCHNPRALAILANPRKSGPSTRRLTDRFFPKRSGL